MQSGMLPGAAILMILIFLVIYFLPTIVAMNRKHQSTVGIVLLNILLGWTFLGWVIAFVWAFSNPIHVVVNNKVSERQGPAQSNVADEIEKLAHLKDKGLLTEEEFNQKKQQVLNG